MSFLIGLGLGFLVGWIAFNRPQWADNFWAWLKLKFGWRM